MKLIGYVRVSTEEQARGGVSLDAQVDKIETYTKLVDAELVDVVVDAGKSGKDTDRPGLQKVLKALERGEADGLVVYAIDRLSRSTLDFLRIVTDFRARGIAFVSVREQMDTSTPHGRFALTILAAVAEMEREMIAARCREASERCAREGRLAGKPPFGWRAVGGEVKDGKRTGGRLEPNPEELETLHRIQALRDAGFTYRAVAKRLNGRGIPAKNGGQWYASAVRSVVKANERLEKLQNRGG